MAGDLLLALDLGTTHVRALAVDLSGAVRGRAVARLTVRFPGPGRVEQDAEEFVATSGEVLRAALRKAGAAVSDVAALGIATQRASALAWDAETGRPLAPVLGWQDQRAAEISDLLRERGLPIGAQASAAKFVWWLERCEPVRDAARNGRLRVGTPDAWLSTRLGGAASPVTDPGQASCTALYDPGRANWSPVLLERVGLAATALPRIVASAEVVSETHADLLGAPVPLAARAGDQQASAFAQGVHAPGNAKLTLGTAGMFDVHVGDKLRPPPPGTLPLALWRLPGGEEAWCLEGQVSTAGAAVEWLISLGVLRRAGDLDALAGSVADSGGVVFVPAFQGLGAPFQDDAARGFVGGLTRGSERGHLARALVEGLAQRCADVAEALGDATTGSEAPLPVDGGLSQSDVLLQSLADLLGRPVERAAEPETTALGAAWLAALATGHLRDPASCRALQAPGRRFEPQLALAQRDAARARWHDILTRRVRT